jgi:hypothetical protein
MVALQIGHVIEHISMVVLGRALLGPQFDSEISHFVFNTGIALLALYLIAIRRSNPWLYPLAAIAVLHGAEHAFILEEYIRTGNVAGPGLIGAGGLIEIFPIQRMALHNTYNGLELVLMVMGLHTEIQPLIDPSEVATSASR